MPCIMESLFIVGTKRLKNRLSSSSGCSGCLRFASDCLRGFARQFAVLRMPLFKKPHSRAPCSAFGVFLLKRSSVAFPVSGKSRNSTQPVKLSSSSSGCALSLGSSISLGGD